MHKVTFSSVLMNGATLRPVAGRCTMCRRAFACAVPHSHALPDTCSNAHQVFDIVSWDPRGVGRSTSVNCFPDMGDMAAFFDRKQLDMFYPTFKHEADAWIERLQQLAGPCADGNGQLLPYLSTADSALDLDVLRAAVGDERLSYYGTSYGTLLGATYANLFPDRIRAMVGRAGLPHLVYH